MTDTLEGPKWHETAMHIYNTTATNHSKFHKTITFVSLSENEEVGSVWLFSIKINIPFLKCHFMPQSSGPLLKQELAGVFPHHRRQRTNIRSTDA